jgi:methyl-accepting chemotaxis protein
VTSSGRGDDPAALERAAKQLHDIARKARRQAGVLSSNATRVTPVAAGVKSVIGGTASGSDRKMIGTLERGVSDLNAAAQSLAEAARTAEQLAQEAGARALRAREERAARGRG